MPQNDKRLTTSSGALVDDDQNSMTAGVTGPVLLQDVHLVEKLAHFNRERIPERIVHAKGAGAFGYFEVTHDVTNYTRAKFLSEALRRSRFSVDRRGDLVTAWFRRYPRARCEEALAMLGRLTACSRQLDMLIANTRMAHDYAERFLAGDYEMFR
jgi:hypothetical protein